MNEKPRHREPRQKGACFCFQVHDGIGRDERADDSSDLTTELSDAGGPARPNRQLTWPARVRSSDLVRP